MITIVFIVHGPPASGKTTYVKNHKTKKDLVIDLDLIMEALTMENRDNARINDQILQISLKTRNFLCDLVSKGQFDRGNVYITTCLQGSKLIDLIDMFPYSKEIFLDVSESECMQRVWKDKNRTDKELHIDIIYKYFTTQ